MLINKCQNCKQCNDKLCLNKVAIFKQLTDNETTQVLTKIQHFDIKKGDVIIHEGDKTSTLYFINTGIAKLIRTSNLGKEQIISLETDGDIIGEYYLLSDYEPYNFTAIALTDMKLCALAKKDIDIILDTHPHLCRAMITELSKKMINIENQLQNITITDTDSKIAYLLLQLNKKFGVKTDKGDIIYNPLTREDMASFTGLTRETMSRYLSKLTKDNIIELIDNRRIRIIDKDHLETLI